MRRLSAALFISLGCAPIPLPTPAAATSHAMRSFDQGIRAFERPVTLAVWSAVEGEAEPTPDDPEPVDPTSLLTWATPPPSVGCVVRGTGAPFVEPCETELVTVHERGVDIAQFDPLRIELVWGIPRREDQAAGLWVHGRGGGASVTGHARQAMKFAVRGEVMVVKDHVWAKKDAPVIPRHADDGVSVSIQDEVLGVAEVRATVACDDLAFDILEPTSFAAPVVPAPEGKAEPVVRYAAGSTLALFAEPGGEILTTLRGTEDRPLFVDLEVKDTRGAFTRVSFETTHARFDVWVRTSEIGEEGGGGFGLLGRGCGGSGTGHSSTGIIARTSAIHLGKDTPNKKPTSGLQIAAGTVFIPGERKDGFIAISPFDSPIVPIGDQLFWVPETALTAP